MKIVRTENAEKYKFGNTCSVLDYSFTLNEKNMDFCINTISGRYPMEGYCSNLEVEELCYILDGQGIICTRGREPVGFKKGDIIFINKKDIYYWDGDFKIAVVCSPAWSKEQCKLYSEDDFR